MKSPVEVLEDKLAEIVQEYDRVMHIASTGPKKLYDERNKEKKEDLDKINAHAEKFRFAISVLSKLE